MGCLLVGGTRVRVLVMQSARTRLPSALGATVWCSNAACPLHTCWLVSGVWGCLACSCFLLHSLVLIACADDVSGSCHVLVLHTPPSVWVSLLLPTSSPAFSGFVCWKGRGLVCFGRMPTVQAPCAACLLNAITVRPLAGCCYPTAPAPGPCAASAQAC